MNPELIDFHIKNENDKRVKIKIDVKCFTWTGLILDQVIDRTYSYKTSYVDNDYHVDPFTQVTSNDDDEEQWVITAHVDFDATPTDINNDNYKQLFLDELKKKLNSDFKREEVTKNSLKETIKRVKDDLTAEKANKLLAEIQKEEKKKEDFRNYATIASTHITNNYSPTLHQKASKKLKGFFCEHARDLKHKFHR